MKKLLQILSATVVCAGLAVGVAAAQSNTTVSECSIYQSSSASYNSCVNHTNNSVRVTCKNDTYVIDNTSQQAGTGNATITGNGSVGYVASGNAEDQNGTAVTIGASCGKPASSTSTVPTSTPTSSGKGAGATPTATPSSSTTIAASSLPETGSNAVITDTMIGAGALFGALALSYVGSALVRRAALK